MSHALKKYPNETQMKPKFNSHAWQRDGTCKDTLFLKTIVNPADTIDKNGYIDT